MEGVAGSCVTTARLYPADSLSSRATWRGKGISGLEGFPQRFTRGYRFPSFQLKALITSTRLGAYYNSSSIYSFG